MMLMYLVVALMVFNCVCLIHAVVEEDGFIQVYDNALPAILVPALIEEAELVAQWSTKQGNLVHDKRKTFWLPISSKKNTKASRRWQRPRSYLELAVQLLSRYVDYNNSIISPSTSRSIVGAEWWIQKVGSNEDISFHFDKDEAAASLANTRKFPLVSTVTYLSDVGGPTVIFNVTTDLSGNRNFPDIPETGFIVFPKENRHLLFRGNLQHGVVGGAAQHSAHHCTRWTLLINWWSSVPQPPNTIQLSNGILHDIGLGNLMDVKELDRIEPIAINYDEELDLFCSRQHQSFTSRLPEIINAADDGLSPTLRAAMNCLPSCADFVTPSVQMNIDGFATNDVCSSVCTRLGKGGDYISIAKIVLSSQKYVTNVGPSPQRIVSNEIFLPSPDLTNQFQVEFPPGDIFLFFLPRHLHPHGVYFIRWSEKQIFGNVGALDLHRPAQVSQLFQLTIPKVLLLYDPRDRRTISEVSPVFFQLARKYRGRLKFYFCGMDKCSDTLNVFQLSANYLPVYVFHDTARNYFEVMRDDFSTDIEDVELFIESVEITLAVEN